MHFIEKCGFFPKALPIQRSNYLYLWHTLCNQYFMKHLYLVFFFFVCSLGFAQNSQAGADIDGFKLYPNPVTQGKIYIETTKKAPKQILIFDVLGTQVLQTTIIGRELNLSSLDKGVYILRVFENNKVATRKLIIK